MSDFDSLREDFARAFDAISAQSEAQRRFNEVTNSSFKELWDSQAELRDELYALSNRVESLTRAIMAEPGDVAERILRDANRG